MFTLATVINIRRISSFPGQKLSSFMHHTKPCAVWKTDTLSETRGWEDRSKEFPSRSKLPQFFSLQLNPDITTSRATSRRRKNVRNMSRHRWNSCSIACRNKTFVAPVNNCVINHKMITLYRIREMVSFELGEEIKKDVFRLVTSVGQREKSFSISLPSSKPYHLS